MKKVLLGMSGGVDSSVAAILLQKQGYEVIGITMALSKETDDADAKKVCQELGIEHHFVDMKNEFKKHVIDNFIDCYANAKTPNPCIECNRKLKFGVMFEKAKELGCDYLATGHYANIEYSDKYNQYVLKKGDAIGKDQSYVLYTLPSGMLENVIFPLGKFKTKDEIRKIAKENNLNVVANKPDSEDICFIPDGNYKKFLEENSNIKPKTGNIVLQNGTILGKHSGLYNYTIGQRKGLGIAYKEPLFVLGFNVRKNEVIVGTKEEVYKDFTIVENVNILIDDLEIENLHVKVKTRYSNQESEAILQTIDSNMIKINFIEPVKALTPGQSAVFYIDDVVIGGGIIKKVD